MYDPEVVLSEEEMIGLSITAIMTQHRFALAGIEGDIDVHCKPECPSLIFIRLLTNALPSVDLTYAFLSKARASLSLHGLPKGYMRCGPNHHRINGRRTNLAKQHLRTISAEILRWS